MSIEMTNKQFRQLNLQAKNYYTLDLLIDNNFKEQIIFNSLTDMHNFIHTHKEQFSLLSTITRNVIQYIDKYDVKDLIEEYHIDLPFPLDTPYLKNYTVKTITYKLEEFKYLIATYTPISYEYYIKQVRLIPEIKEIGKPYQPEQKIEKIKLLEKGNGNNIFDIVDTATGKIQKNCIIGRDKAKEEWYYNIKPKKHKYVVEIPFTKLTYYKGVIK